METPNIIEYETPIELRFMQKWHEYGDVYSFEFKPSEPVPFLAGQNARIVIPALSEDEGKRSLSFASTPDEETVLFSMHTDSESTYTRAFLTLNEGDTVHLVKIKGQTVLPEDTSIPLVFVAGGIGVTPFRSMLLYMYARDLPTKAILLHVSRNRYLYEDELTDLPYEQHRIERDELAGMIEESVSRYPTAMYYIAGSPTFLEGVQALLHEQNVPEDNVLLSRFTGYEDRTD